jgi:basic membrane lipoprotein Med (substrate-binding protein (PBP1-ABC) superfamily)
MKVNVKMKLILLTLFVGGIFASCQQRANKSADETETSDNTAIYEDSPSTDDTAWTRVEAELNQLEEKLSNLSEQDPDFQQKLEQELENFDEKMEEIGNDLEATGEEVNNELITKIEEIRGKSNSLHAKLQNQIDQAGNEMADASSDIKEEFNDLKRSLQEIE